MNVILHKGIIETDFGNCKKAIPYLEQALSLKADDKNCMIALRKLYFLTGNEAKGKEMTEKLKGK